MMDRKRVIIGIVFVLLVAGLFFLRRPGGPLESSPPPSPVEKSSAAVDPQPSPVPSRIAMKPPEIGELAEVPPNPMAAAIGSDNLTPEKEIELVLELFQIYRREFGAFPAGEGNAQFMNALRGANPGKLPVFPPQHPRLDPKGNLVDRWGQPYIFHAVSRDRLEIRSKGPDQEIFTTDDLVIPR